MADYSVQVDITPSGSAPTNTKRRQSASKKFFVSSPSSAAQRSTAQTQDLGQEIFVVRIRPSAAANGMAKYQSHFVSSHCYRDVRHRALATVDRHGTT
jgi:hypothetical protein